MPAVGFGYDCLEKSASLSVDRIAAGLSAGREVESPTEYRVIFPLKQVFGLAECSSCVVVVHNSDFRGLSESVTFSETTTRHHLCSCP